jgi:hypothetical protein
VTKASLILVRPQQHLPSVLSDQERDVLRKVLLDQIRGIDEEHHRRWRRFIGNLINSEPDEITQFLNPRTRSQPFHKRWMAIERAVFESQERFATRKGFRRWLKTGAGLGEYEREAGRLMFVPGSVGFDECSDDEMREFVKAAEDFLHTDFATRRLWPHLKAAARQEMLDTILNAKEHTQ